MPNMSRLLLPEGPQPVQVLGDVVSRRRHALGLSQEALAERCGLDRTYVSSVERGKRNPTLHALCRLSIGLELARGALLDAVVDAVADQNAWYGRAVERGSVEA